MLEERRRRIIETWGRRERGSLFSFQILKNPYHNMEGFMKSFLTRLTPFPETKTQKRA